MKKAILFQGLFTLSLFILFGSQCFALTSEEKDIYSSTVERILHEPYGEYATYAQVDLNNDEVSELIVSHLSDDEISSIDEVFTINNGSCISVGFLYGPNSYYETESGEGIYAVNSYQGYGTKDVVHMIDNKISINTELEGEIVDWSEFTNDSPIYKNKLVNFHNEQIIPGSDARFLTDEDIQFLNDTGLELAKNEIYARHGYIFEIPYIDKYFMMQSWYTPSVSAKEFSNSAFNEYEAVNITLLANKEEKSQESSLEEEQDDELADVTGIYDASKCEKDGESYQCDREYLSLNEDGSGEVQFNGKVYSLTWNLDGTSLSFTDEDGDTAFGTLEDDTIHIKYIDFQYEYIKNHNNLSSYDTSDAKDNTIADIVENFVDTSNSTPQQNSPIVYGAVQREIIEDPTGVEEADSIWPNDYIALNEDGRGIFLFNGAVFTIRWKEEQGDFSFTDHRNNMFQGTIDFETITGVYGRYRYTFERKKQTLPAYTFSPQNWGLNLPPLVDEANVFTDDEEEDFAAKGRELSDTFDIGVYAVFLDKVEDYTWSDSIKTLTEELMAGYSIGIGATDKKEQFITNEDWKDSVILLVSLDSREYDLCVSGDYANMIFTNPVRERILDAFMEDLKADKYSHAVGDYLDSVKYILNSKVGSYNEDDGKYYLTDSFISNGWKITPYASWAYGNEISVFCEVSNISDYVSTFISSEIMLMDNNGIIGNAWQDEYDYTQIAPNGSFYSNIYFSFPGNMNTNFDNIHIIAGSEIVYLVPKPQNAKQFNSIDGIYYVEGTRGNIMTIISNQDGFFIVYSTPGLNSTTWYNVYGENVTSWEENSHGIWVADYEWDPTNNRIKERNALGDRYFYKENKIIG